MDGNRSGDRVELPADTALPPPGRYVGTVDGTAGIIEVTGADALRIIAGPPTGDGPTTVAFHGREAGTR